MRGTFGLRSQLLGERLPALLKRTGQAPKMFLQMAYRSRSSAFRKRSLPRTHSKDGGPLLKVSGSILTKQAVTASKGKILAVFPVSRDVRVVILSIYYQRWGQLCS